MNRNLRKAISILEVNTYSVEIESMSGNPEELGSAFALSKDTLLTAYHVIEDEETKSPIPKVVVRNDDDFEVTGTITRHDIVSDLAIIQCDEELTKVESYKFDSKIPKVGSSCIWGGYPKIYGEEETLRKRFAQGIISSCVYPQSSKQFMEVDGIVSYGHSGSAVFNCDNGKILGVMIGSAGDFRNHMNKSLTFIKALRVLVEKWDIFEEIVRNMEELNKQKNDIIKVLNDKLDCNLYEDGFYSGRWDVSIPRIIQPRVQKALEDLSIHVSRQKTPWGDHPEGTNLTAFSQDIAFKALLALLTSWTENIELALQETVQVGIGTISLYENIKPLLN